jgi:hypothetical protein
MLRAKADVEDEDGIGLWFPSPSEYDPLAFLSSLADTFGNAVERRLTFRAPLASQLLYGSSVPKIAAVASGAMLVISGILYVLRPVALAPAALTIAAISSAYLLFSALVLLVFGARRLRTPTGRLETQARLIRERIRFSLARKEGTEASLQAGRGIVSSFRSSFERELTERPMTLSSLIHDFRALTEQAATVAGSVLIAIDELDKLDDPQRARALLRDIKGIFDVPGVFFLVSISYEAARSLSLGSLIGCDEFSSSFYTVVDVPPLSPTQGTDLIASRTGKPSPRVAEAISVLAGGNPREILRIADLSSDLTSVDASILSTMRGEVEAFRRSVVSFAPVGSANALSESAKLQCHQALGEVALESEGEFCEYVRRIGPLFQHPPSWTEPAWNEHFELAWERLGVRLQIASALLENSNLNSTEERGVQLSRVVAVAEQSPGVARVMLEDL